MIQIRLILAVLVAFALLASAPAYAQQNSGNISPPFPIPGIPGCYLNFSSPPGPDQPNFPCAWKCSGGSMKPGSKPGQSHKEVCEGFGSSSTGNDASHPDHPGRLFPPAFAPEGSTTCLMLTGEPGLPNGTTWFPKGHPRCAGVSGEPHLHTFDRARFDLQAAGEFIFAKSLNDNLEVQARLEARGDVVSVATAVAARIGEHRVTVTAGDEVPLRIDGRPVDLVNESFLILPERVGSIVRVGRGYSLVWPDGTNVNVNVYPKMIDFWVLAAKPRDGRLVGILGNADGDDGSNDFHTRDGRALASPPDFETLYGVFAESWRIKQEESLFDYGPGENTETFTRRPMPARKVALLDIDADKRSAAEDRCRTAGVIDPLALADCTFDLALTGDETMIESALSWQQPAEFYDADSAPILSASATVESGKTLSATWRGPAKEGDYVSVALPEHPGNRYASYVYVQEGSPLALTAPDASGQYELRYVDGRSRQILARRPLEVLAVNAALTAMAEVNSGAPFQLEWTGPANDRDYVSVAAPDHPASRYVSYRYTRLGSPVEMTAPDAPGKYELRYVQGQSREILATRPITVLAVEATLQAPERVAPGSELSVEWTGPGNAKDYLSFATPNDSANQYKSYSYTRLGSPLTMTAPEEAGEYELRYVQGQSRTILVRRTIVVR